jgi:hypothetical protein
MYVCPSFAQVTEETMTFFQPQVDRQKPFVTMILITAHLIALTVTLAFVYLAWDGRQVIQRIVERKAVSVYSIEVYEAVYEHYFQNATEPSWSPLALFIGVSNVIHLYLVAPAVLSITTYLLSRQLRARGRWLVIGSSLGIGSLLLWLAPSLRSLSVILD